MLNLTLIFKQIFPKKFLNNIKIKGEGEMKKLLPLALAGIVFVSCGSKTESAKIESKLAVQQAVKGDMSNLLLLTL